MPYFTTPCQPPAPPAPDRIPCLVTTTDEGAKGARGTALGRPRVLVSVGGSAGLPRQIFVARLLAWLKTGCRAAASFDSAGSAVPDQDILLLAGDTAELPPECRIRIHLGAGIPPDSGAGWGRIDVRDITHPDAARQTAAALLQFPVLEHLRPLVQLGPPPRVRAVASDVFPDPEAVFGTLYAEARHSVWLDSSNAAGAPVADRNRFSIMADSAGAGGWTATHKDGVTTMDSPLLSCTLDVPFFTWLDHNWPQHQSPGAGIEGLGFSLGWMGYLGYELKRECGGDNRQSPLPDAALLRCTRALVFDHRERVLYLLAEEGDEAEAWIARTLIRLRNVPAAAPDLPALGNGTVFRGADTSASYLRKVATCQQEIVQGNSYEICLTTSLSAPLDGQLDPWNLYRHLRRASPAPFASFLRMDGITLASSSPERFLRIDVEGRIRAEPIKGTRRRGEDPAADEALYRELQHSGKDRAENIMIVDLLRNDLSRNAAPGSVTVPRLCAIESYATVHQMVSTVDARLAPEASRAGLIAGAFPPGSMTGAPKISSMDILDRLETGARGPYAGAVGYFSPNGAADLAVTIRCAVIDEGSGRLSVGVGGAVTADSIPAEELAEIHTKAAGILGVLGSRFPA